jgi:hypothetical protein
MTGWAKMGLQVGRDLAISALLFGVIAGLGFGVLVVLFKAGVYASVPILFYRGLILCAVAFVLTAIVGSYALGWLRLGTVRDGFAAACLSLGFNLAFLVIVPVTVDRSVSVFMLAYMDAHESERLSARDIEAAFDRIYVRDLKAIDRRLAEQIQSGNVETDGGTYAISARGRHFITTAQFVAWLFDTDTRLLLRGLDEQKTVAQSGVSSSGTPR